MNPAFWHGKRVLITGHTGFKGSWLTLWLHHLGATLCGYALAPTAPPNLCEDIQLASICDSIVGDVRDLGTLTETIRSFQPDVVFHLAAQALVRTSYQNPVATYATNMMGTVHLLESVRHVPSVRVVVNVTSDKCYDNQSWHWAYRENDRLGGHDPYSASKACSELISQAYQSSFFRESHIKLATARAGNVIGGGDWAVDRLIPDMMRAFLQSEAVTIRYPNAVRPWQHVLEALSGYLHLAEALWNPPQPLSPGASLGWNFGPRGEDAQPVHWVADYVANVWGNAAPWQQDTQIHPHEAPVLRLDCTQAQQILGWRPCLTLPQTLDWTVSWYQAYQRFQRNPSASSAPDLREMTLAQIREYQQLCLSAMASAFTPEGGS